MKKKKSQTVAKNILSKQLKVGEAYKLKTYVDLLSYPYSISGGGRAKFIEYLNSFAIVTKVEGKFFYTYGGTRTAAIGHCPDSFIPKIYKASKIPNVMYIRCVRKRVEGICSPLGVTYKELFYLYYGISIIDELDPAKMSSVYPKELHMGFECFFSIIKTAFYAGASRDRQTINKTSSNSVSSRYVVCNQEKERFATDEEVEIIQQAMKAYNMDRMPIVGTVKYRRFRKYVNHRLTQDINYVHKVYFYQFGAEFKNKELYTDDVVQKTMVGRLAHDVSYLINRDVHGDTLKSCCNLIFDIWRTEQLWRKSGLLQDEYCESSCKSDTTID